MTEPKTRILVVDDDLRLRELLERYLAEQGFAADSVADGRALDASLNRERYDLVVLDLMLPGMPGLELCRRLRADTAQLPIIVVSAKSSASDKALGLAMGADDYVTKPFSPRDLLTRAIALLPRR